MNRNEVIELLKSYRSYKQAIHNFRTHQSIPSAGIANYSGMPGGSGATELFFTQQGRMADMGFTSALDFYDNELYVSIVQTVDFTVEQVLSDNEAFVIRMKYLERNKMDLCKIAEFKDKDESTIRRWHRIALKQMAIALSTIPSQAIPKLEKMKNARSVPA